MELDAARQFLRQHHRAVLATRGPGERPQLSPVAVAVNADGAAVISTREPAYKTRNVRRDPAVSLCVFTDAFFGPWVWVAGEATVVSLPAAMDGLVEYYRSVSGEHPDWAEYREAMERDRRCLLVVSLTAAGPDRSG